MESARAIQIIAPVEFLHSFELKVENLRNLPQFDDIKDHFLVIVSIAGDFRKGKSFLLNFCLKYLYAQVKSDTELNYIVIVSKL